MMELTQTNVNKILVDCFFEDEKAIPDDALCVTGSAVMRTFCLNAEKVEKNADKIYELLQELPIEFFDGKAVEGGGGGWSFLQACMDKHGKHWGEHLNIDELLALGLASGWVSYLLPRELWAVLPGGMPYFMVNTERKAVEKKTMREIKASA